LFRLNVEAYPTSANAHDSLADGYIANGQIALAAEEKCLELLPADTINPQFKAALRQVAEQKIAKLKAKSLEVAGGDGGCGPGRRSLAGTEVAKMGHRAPPTRPFRQATTAT
jgi:hypothetical protein